MAEVVFAMFDENMAHLKMVRMRDITYGARVRLEECDSASSIHRSMVIKRSQEPEPTLTRITLESGNAIYLWRTSMCVYHARTGKWIHILDSNCLSAIPGEFTYREDCISRLFSGSRNARCKALHNSMLENIRQQEPSLSVRAPAQEAPAAKVPAFVAAILKKNAIVNRDTCAITFDEITQDTKTMVTPCFHIFTETGMLKWLEINPVCPSCKASVDKVNCLFV